MEIVQDFRDIGAHTGPHTVLIILPTIRVLLIVNRWYISEHYYFRNIQYIQRRYMKRKFGDPCFSPGIIYTDDIDVRSIFVINEEKKRDICVTPRSTFYTLM